MLVRALLRSASGGARALARPFLSMKIAIAAISRKVAGVSCEDSMADRRALCATTRTLEIISQAARRLTEYLRDRLP
jgi:hypothetical protein